MHARIDPAMDQSSQRLIVQLLRQELEAYKRHKDNDELPPSMLGKRKGPE